MSARVTLICPPTGIAHSLIGLGEAHFEYLRTYLHTHRCNGPGGLVRTQLGKLRFIDAAEHLPVEGAISVPFRSLAGSQRQSPNGVKEAAPPVPIAGTKREHASSPATGAGPKTSDYSTFTLSRAIAPTFR